MKLFRLKGKFFLICLMLVVTSLSSKTLSPYEGLSIEKNIPDSWKVISWAPPGSDGGPAEFRPIDQQNERWHEAIKIRTFNNGPFKLEDFARGLTRFNHKEECNYYNQSPPESDSKNDFLSITLIDSCGYRRTTGMGDITIFKVISSPGWLIVGERTIRLPTFAEGQMPVPGQLEILKQWSRGFYLCSNDNSGRDCRTGR